MEFDSNLPANCPPNNASSASGEVYRFSKTVPLTTADFVSYLNEKGAGAFPQTKICLAGGLSVLVNEENVRDAIKASPFLRKRSVIKALVDHTWGVMKATPGQWPGHHTWWIPKDRDPRTIFVVVVLE